MHSPAKINLGLKIPYKRPDGYHEIQSIFLPITFGDEIQITRLPKKKGLTLISENCLKGDRYQLFEAVSERGDLKKNILHKTYQFLLELNPDLPGLQIHLKKKIPPGGGLGGGSGNASVLIRDCTPESQLESKEFLQKIAFQLGADIPFFIKNKPAYITGIGDQMETIIMSHGFGVLAIPEISMDTKTAYQMLKKPLQESPDSKKWNFLTGDMPELIKTGQWKLLAGKLENEFEAPVFRLYPQLGDIKTAFMREGAEFASMTGSGSCIFALCSEDKQETIVKRMMLNFIGVSFEEFQF